MKIRVNLHPNLESAKVVQKLSGQFAAKKENHTAPNMIL